MKKIKLVFESNENKIGYLIDPETKVCVSGKFNNDLTEIIEDEQTVVIEDISRFTKQLSFVLAAAIRDA